MLTYNMDKRGQKPLYDYLYQCIRNDILSGKLSAHEKLPSKRALSQNLNISIITVENAYSLLKAEGYIYSVQKSGYYVASLEKTEFSAKKACIKVMAEASKDYFADFYSNNVNPEFFPFTTWAKLMRAVLAEQDKKLLRSVPYNGIYELRQAISVYLYHLRSMSVQPEQIIIGSGTEYLYNLIIQLLGRDKVFAIENPGYKKISKIYNINGVECRYINVDNSGISVEELEKTDSSIVHISPNHHFPTGTVTSIGRRQELLRWCGQGNNRYIIEDDYDSEFRFIGRPIQTMQSIDTQGKVIYINTFSKTIAPSIRISYMVLPEKLLKTFQDCLGFYTCPVPSFEQFALAEFINQGYFERHISRMKNYYKSQRDKIIAVINNSPLKEEITITEEDSGLHFLMKFKRKIDKEQLEKLEIEKGIRIKALSDYYHSKTQYGDNILVVNYSGVNSDRLEEAFNSISEYLL